MMFATALSALCLASLAGLPQAPPAPPPDAPGLPQQAASGNLSELPVRSLRFKVEAGSVQAVKDCVGRLPVARDCAGRLAEAYFELVYGRCGMLKDPTESADRWTFPCLVGIGAGEADPIVIEKRTGRITCGSREALDSPLALLKRIERPPASPQRPRIVPKVP